MPMPTEVADMAPRELNFITGNKNKLIEIQAILGDTVQLKSQSLDLVEIQGTIEEVSTDKCRRAAEVVCHSDSAKVQGRPFNICLGQGSSTG